GRALLWAVSPRAREFLVSRSHTQTAVLPPLPARSSTEAKTQRPHGRSVFARELSAKGWEVEASRAYLIAGETAPGVHPLGWKSCSCAETRFLSRAGTVAGTPATRY